MKKIIYLAFLLFAVAGWSQSFEWVKTPEIDYQFSADMMGYNTVCDPEGNIYLAGYKDNALSYSDIFGTVMYNKYDGSGMLLFSKTFTGDGNCYALHSDTEGNILAAFGYVNTITIDELTKSSTDIGVKFLFVKFDSSGNILWHKDITIIVDDFNWINNFSSIATDYDDNIYLGYDSYHDSYITKFSPDGAELMTIAQTNVNRITSVSVDNEGYIYAAGSCANIVATYAGVAAPTDFQYNTYVVKYSPDGEFQWIKYVDDITCPEPRVVARTPDEVYYSSYLFGSFNFDTITAEGPAASFEDFFLAKLNDKGQYQWVREVPGSGSAGQGNRNYLAVDQSGNIYFAGFTAGTINWGNGVITSSPSLNKDALIIKYNPEGQVLMAKTVQADGHARADGVTIDSSGDIFIAGMANGNTVFDSFKHKADAFDHYPFFAKIAGPGLNTPGPVKPAAGLYPNPATDHIFIYGVANGTKAAIINMLGQVVQHFEINSEVPIPLSDLAKGTYFIKADGYNAVRFLKH